MTVTSSPAPPEARPEAAFVGELKNLARRADGGDSTSRASLARLRRTLTGRTLQLDGLREIGSQLPDDLSATALDTYLLAAALFALSPSAGPDAAQESLGGTLRRLRGRLSAGAESLDRRFSALLNAGVDDLPYRLRQVVQQLAGQNMAPNYYRLLDDLLAWDPGQSRHSRSRTLAK